MAVVLNIPLWGFPPKNLLYIKNRPVERFYFVLAM